MKNIEITVRPGPNLSRAEPIIEACCRSAGLRITLKATLRKYPGSIRWHCKHGGESGPGTLEITVWPKARRLWLSVHAGRTADWIADGVVHLKDSLERRVR